MLGVIGAVIVLGALLAGDVIDLGDGWISAPVIGGFLAAFGLAGAVMAPRVGTTLAVVIAAGSGLAVGLAAALLTRSLLRMRTDATPRTADLVGRAGMVISPISPVRYGQVRVDAYGQPFQLSARADEDLEVGRQIVVVEVTSPTSVVVTGLDL